MFEKHTKWHGHRVKGVPRKLQMGRRFGLSSIGTDLKIELAKIVQLFQLYHTFTFVLY